MAGRSRHQPCYLGAFFALAVDSSPFSVLRGTRMMASQAACQRSNQVACPTAWLQDAKFGPHQSASPLT